jgi:hypothetical protein
MRSVLRSLLSTMVHAYGIMRSLSGDQALPLGRFPTVLLSRSDNTVLVVRGSATNAAVPSVQMSWAGTRNSVIPDLVATDEPPAYVPRDMGCLLEVIQSHTHSSRSYAEMAIPTAPVIYTFFPPTGETARALLSTSPDDLPLFSVAVVPDTFTPILANTILFRAPDSQGRSIPAGSFE